MMDAVIELLKMLLKGVLLFVGGLMLLGGGICVLVDAGLLVTGSGPMAALFLVISLAVALAGWGVSKFSLTMQISKSGENEPRVIKESDAA